MMFSTDCNLESLQVNTDFQFVFSLQQFVHVCIKGLLSLYTAPLSKRLVLYTTLFNFQMVNCTSIQILAS